MPNLGILLNNIDGTLDLNVFYDERERERERESIFLSMYEKLQIMNILEHFQVDAAPYAMDFFMYSISTRTQKSACKQPISSESDNVIGLRIGDMRSI